MDEFQGLHAGDVGPPEGKSAAQDSYGIVLPYSIAIGRDSADRPNLFSVVGTCWTSLEGRHLGFRM